MRQMLSSLILLVAVAAGPAQADCYAAYQAKRDAPLRLHFGVIALAIDPCEVSPEMEKDIAARIGQDGWKLLQVVRTLNETQVENERKNAGDYYLRY